MTRPRGSLPKVCGGDIELANFILGGPDKKTGNEAARALLREIDGVMAGSFYEKPAQTAFVSHGVYWINGTDEDDPQDVDRRFLTGNGGCAYIDLAHLELCLPEVTSAFDHVACWHALLRIARGAQVRANEALPYGQTVKVLANNSDGRGHTFGSHLNFLVTRRCWEHIFRRRLHHALHLATYLASAILFAGAGKVGSECGADGVGFQISQRADFFTSLVSSQTTFERPLLNSRDESHACDEMARFHLILFDSTLTHGASLLKVGVTQIVLAMMEQEQTDPLLFLEDPVDALHRWSCDPDLKAVAPLATGEHVTALDVQWIFFERASRFVGAGRADGVVPEVHRILALWEDTLGRLGRDVESLTGRLDWVLKRSLLRRAMETHGLDEQAPEIRLLDQVYHSLDPDEGLFWSCERDGALERYVSEERILHFVDAPPEDTRAWGRAQLLRRGGIKAVDWNRIKFEDGTIIDMRDPLRFTRLETGALERSQG